MTDPIRLIVSGPGPETGSLHDTVLITPDIARRLLLLAAPTWGALVTLVPAGGPTDTKDEAMHDPPVAHRQADGFPAGRRTVIPTPPADTGCPGAQPPDRLKRGHPTNDSNATSPAEAQGGDAEEAWLYTPCGICGEKIKRNKYGTVVQYHDCKPVPGAKLNAANAEVARLTAELEQAKRDAAEARASQRRLIDDSHLLPTLPGVSHGPDVFAQTVAAFGRLAAELEQAKRERDSLKAELAAEREKRRMADVLWTNHLAALVPATTLELFRENPAAVYDSARSEANRLRGLRADLSDAIADRDDARAQVATLEGVLKSLCGAVGALCQNHPLRSDGHGVCQLHDGATTERLWLDAASKMTAATAVLKEVGT